MGAQGGRTLSARKRLSALRGGSPRARVAAVALWRIRLVLLRFFLRGFLVLRFLVLWLFIFWLLVFWLLFLWLLGLERRLGDRRGRLWRRVDGRGSDRLGFRHDGVGFPLLALLRYQAPKVVDAPVERCADPGVHIVGEVRDVAIEPSERGSRRVAFPCPDPVLDLVEVAEHRLRVGRRKLSAAATGTD
ncbi:MAG: hypothetical protein M3217_10150 [Actinomycetota bacterium]|nr:hypothetical protein [Actinomycetota bacterium]